MTAGKEHRVRVLPEPDCNALASKVLAMKHLAHEGQKDFFYTVGNALYQHDDPAVYFRKAARLNPRLFDEFGLLYKKILHHLSAFLGCEAGFLHGFSLPGFHLFEVGKNNQYTGGGTHFDLSYTKAFPGFTPYLPHYSFTLPLQLPVNPSGLEIWDLHYKSMSQAPPGFDPVAASKTRQSRFIDYQTGEMVIFDGHYLHRIAGTEKVLPTDRRITLQGHCLFINGHWAIYF